MQLSLSALLLALVPSALAAPSLPAVNNLNVSPSKLSSRHFSAQICFPYSTTQFLQPEAGTTIASFQSYAPWQEPYGTLDGYGSPVYEGINPPGPKSGLIGVAEYKAYDPVKCKSTCDKLRGCTSFAIWRERIPRQKYNILTCRNPSANPAFQVKCTFYLKDLSQRDATNRAQVVNNGRFKVTQTSVKFFNKATNTPIPDHTPIPDSTPPPPVSKVVSARLKLVKNDGSIYGYVGGLNPSFGTSNTAASASDAIIVTYDASSSPFNINSPAGSSYPYFGVVFGQEGQSGTLSTTGGYLNTGYVSEVAQGTQAKDGKNSLASPGLDGPYQSQVWSIDPTTKILTVTWTNTDGSTTVPPLLLVNFGDGLVFLEWSVEPDFYRDQSTPLTIVAEPVV